ncbi:hemolysin family protein [Accumulibacter sp.]|uniref:hemolysin family protein n=1 Tax=Accumulibacter sp. TaxID=2053492 RepID=UPI0025EDC34B|nr:hemolysin family protein [Accumulibacter sp.]MCM8610872.1 hemolysin family protein [Accumulibacter sp.]MCM8635296.1 hemolysin family protein [Accumulibacter sp.]MCM8639012.1 hemolysin family protein [Accumulibacter sp.]
MDVVLLLLLIVLNGILAMSEIAVVSARQSRLQKLAEDGFSGARSALALQQEPSTFLSTVQVGITTVGILSGAIGEATLAAPLAEWLGSIALLAPHADTVALTLVVVAVTYCSVVVGELVPKRLGLLAPERVASFVAGPMGVVSRLARPLVWLLSSSSSMVLGLLGARRAQDTTVTDDEIKVLMGQGAEAGVFHASEQAIVSNVLRLDEQRISAIMTHRKDIYLLDLNDGEELIRRRLANSPYRRIVVCRDGLDQIVGVLRTSDLLQGALLGQPLEVEAFVRPALYVPASVTTTQLLETFRRAHQQCALMVDEYGGLQGLVTLTDVLTSIVGDLPTSDSPEELDIIVREDGSWLADGSVPIERLKAVLAIHTELPGEEENAFNTLGGFVMYVLGRIPLPADHFVVEGLRFEVVDMDRHRVDKVLIARLAEAGGLGRSD